VPQATSAAAPTSFRSRRKPSRKGGGPPQAGKLAPTMMASYPGRHVTGYSTRPSDKSNRPLRAASAPVRRRGRVCPLKDSTSEPTWLASRCAGEHSGAMIVGVPTRSMLPSKRIALTPAGARAFSAKAPCAVEAGAARAAASAMKNTWPGRRAHRHELGVVQRPSRVRSIGARRQYSSSRKPLPGRRPLNQHTVPFVGRTPGAGGGEGRSLLATLNSVGRRRSWAPLCSPAHGEESHVGSLGRNLHEDEPAAPPGQERDAAPRARFDLSDGLVEYRMTSGPGLRRHYSGRQLCRPGGGPPPFGRFSSSTGTKSAPSDVGLRTPLWSQALGVATACPVHDKLQVRAPNAPSPTISPPCPSARFDTSDSARACSGQARPVPRAAVTGVEDGTVLTSDGRFNGARHRGLLGGEAPSSMTASTSPGAVTSLLGSRRRQISPTRACPSGSTGA